MAKFPSYEDLLQTSLNRLPDDLDKREGSIIYTAIAPACLQLANAYIELKLASDNTFPQTASGEALDLKAEELSLKRLEAQKAVRVLSHNLEATIPVGTVFRTVGDEFPEEFEVIEWDKPLPFDVGTPKKVTVRGGFGNKFQGDNVGNKNVIKTGIVAYLLPVDNPVYKEITTPEYRLIDRRDTNSLISTISGGDTQTYYKKPLVATFDIVAMARERYPALAEASTREIVSMFESVTAKASAFSVEGRDSELKPLTLWLYGYNHVKNQTGSLAFNNTALLKDMSGNISKEMLPEYIRQDGTIVFILNGGSPSETGEKADARMITDYFGIEFELGIPEFFLNKSVAVRALQSGAKGNTYFGEVLPTTSMYELKEAKLSNIVVEGRDVESDINLRKRYFDYIQARPFGGNFISYVDLMSEFSSVGYCQVYPTWNGGGTVKLVIVDKGGNPAKEATIKEVHDYVMGSDTQQGWAPIGHDVTVTAPVESSVSITMSVETIRTVRLDQVIDPIQDEMKSLIASLRLKWAEYNTDHTYNVRLFIGSIISAVSKVEGIVNVTNVKINGSAEDLVFPQTNSESTIPVLGGVVVNEA